MEDLKFTLTNQNAANFDRERRELMQKYENEINRIEFELRRQKEINDTKNKEI